MRSTPITRRGWAIAGLAVLFSAIVPICAQEKEIKYEAQLVWGTDAKEEGSEARKPVDTDVQKKLSELPLKYSHYYEINRKAFGVEVNGSQKIELSAKCEISVRSLKDSKVEVILFGKGKEVMKRTQELPKGEMLVLAGNAPNATAWLVTLKRIE